MSKNILYAIVVIVVLTAAWFLFGFNDGGVAPEAAPAPATSSDAQLEQELNASLQGNVDAELQTLDNEANGL